MIRNRIFILLLLLGIGCTKNDHSSEEPILLDSYIFFDEGTVKTKGNLLEGDVLPAAMHTSYGVMGLRGTSNEQVFGVYNSGGAGTTGNNKYDNVAVMYRPADGEAFTYDKLVLWTNETHKFCAFYPYAADGCITGVAADDATTTGVVDPYLSYIQPTALANMTDILTACKEASYNASASQADNLVALQFSHRLVAMDVVLNNMQSESARPFRVEDAVIEFVGLGKSAKLYFNDGNDSDNLADCAITESFTTPLKYDFITDGNTLEIAAPTGSATSVEYNFNSNNSFLFLPSNSIKVKLIITYTNAWNEVCSYVLDCTSDEKAITPDGGGPFLPGYKYALKINKKDNGQEIEFVPEVITKWENGGDINIEFN